jgi:tetratricopeptide (TPR) repeat protein
VEERSVSGSNRVRFRRILREAEGYLDLNLPYNALEVLDRMKEPGTFRGHKLFLTGRALAALGRHHEACATLEEAADLLPSDLEVWIALGACYRDAGRLDRAIGTLQRAEELEPRPALFYSLARYCSVAQEKQRALDYLSRAIAMDPNLRDQLGDEPDFDSLRSDPEFQALTSIIV